MLGMPLQKGGRALAQVHGHVPDLATQAGHEFHLGVGRLLVVHATHGALEGCIALVDLGDGRRSQASMSARHSARASAPPCCWRYQFMVRATAVFSDQCGATPSTWRAWAVSSASQPASCGPSLSFS